VQRTKIKGALRCAKNENIEQRDNIAAGSARTL